jgi:hypothetical protein
VASSQTSQPSRSPAPSTSPTQVGEGTG